jgi:hypothetical protein
MNKTSLRFSTVIQLRNFQVDDVIIIIVTVEFYKTKIERFQVLTAANKKITAFWDIALCSLAKVYRRFRDIASVTALILQMEPPVYVVNTNVIFRHVHLPGVNYESFTYDCVSPVALSV